MIIAGDKGAPAHHCITWQLDRIIINVDNEELKRGIGGYCIDPSETETPYFATSSRAGSTIRVPAWFE